jgi:hypothetical protein
MYDPPSSAELVTAVAEFLREQAMPHLPGHLAYHARVAANVLEIVSRELSGRCTADAAEQDRLGRLLGSKCTDLFELNRLLCERIERGEFNAQTPGLTEHLWSTALAKMAVDQPGYAAYQREKNRS